MKNNLIYTFLIAICILVNSCSRSDDTTTNNTLLAQTPSAKAQFDNSNYGIYKGVFVGSSGIIVINFNNTSGISAMLIINGVTYNYTTTQTIQQNQNSIINFVNGSSSFTFSVAANGETPIITNVTISGHPYASIMVVKETSTSLVKCYEGTYSGGDSGVFNAVIYNNNLKALVKGSDNSNFIAFGTISNNQIIASGIVNTDVKFTGTVTDNTLSGNWTNTPYKLSGTYTGKRTY